MSKGNSGLFPKKITENARLLAIQDKAKRKVDNLIANTPNGKKKSMAVGAYDIVTGKTTASFAGEPPSDIHPELRRKAEAIGGIGSRGLTERNSVGVCAEFHAVNKLLLAGVSWSNIRLTRATRPRNGEYMPYCANCVALFSDLIKK